MQPSVHHIMRLRNGSELQGRPCSGTVPSPLCLWLAWTVATSASVTWLEGWCYCSQGHPMQVCSELLAQVSSYLGQRYRKTLPLFWVVVCARVRSVVTVACWLSLEHEPHRAEDRVRNHREASPGACPYSGHPSIWASPFPFLLKPVWVGSQNILSDSFNLHFIFSNPLVSPWGMWE